MRGSKEVSMNKVVKVQSPSFSCFPIGSVIDELLTEFLNFNNDPKADYYWTDRFSGQYPNYPVSNHLVASNGDSKLEIAVPGFKKEEITVEIEGSKLTISGVKAERDDPEGVFVHRKLARRDFNLAFKCHPQTDFSNADVSLENGILTVMLPLKEEAKPVRKQLTVK